ncbi:hypothetical protein B0H16DRAFT_156825 [Mycena metata]|uniref:Uncharacterized protein n=1 Tax=Mycena metata TaxID=1033252 RepID=A0AAD7I3F4_9AGAR|nr:hypothetical protein B0H16DRAFT_156825 [Mycena metata]
MTRVTVLFSTTPAVSLAFYIPPEKTGTSFPTPTGSPIARYNKPRYEEVCCSVCLGETNREGTYNITRYELAVVASV